MSDNPTAVHTIRLRKPWTKKLADQTEILRIAVPEPQDSGATAIEATYTRKFNRPTGLDADSRVMLCIDSYAGKLASVTINDTTLHYPAPPCPDEPTHLAIDNHLQDHNELTIQLSPDSANSSVSLGAVSLLILS